MIFNLFSVVKILLCMETLKVQQEFLKVILCSELA